MLSKYTKHKLNKEIKINTISKLIISTVLIVSVLTISGCLGQEKREIITEESLGLRKTDLYTENTTSGAKTNYPKEAAGMSKKFDRAYYNAPPMIPHDTTGFMPITKGLNSCLGCHMPNIASAVGATSIPKSHFKDYRPKHLFDGKMFKPVTNHLKSETVSKELKNLSNARYSCTQCHVPQSKNKLVVGNNF